MAKGSAGSWRRQISLQGGELIVNCKQFLVVSMLIASTELDGCLSWRSSCMLADGRAGFTAAIRRVSLPVEPAVVEPYEEIGQYGGTMYVVTENLRGFGTDMHHWN